MTIYSHGLCLAIHLSLDLSDCILDIFLFLYIIIINSFSVKIWPKLFILGYLSNISQESGDQNEIEKKAEFCKVIWN